MPDSNDVVVEPMDEHNRTLVNNLHPSGYVNPTPHGRYNLVVIGAGVAGLVTSAIAASLGGRVALIERHLMGGDCLNVGCVPSKSLVRSARAVADVRTAGAYGVHVHEHADVSFSAVMKRMRAIRASISPHDSVQRFRDEYGVDVYFGSARFTGTHTLDVDDTSLTFRKAVIATGARPDVPSIPGLKKIPFYTNESIFTLTELPRRLAIIGGGPIGCELAQAFARFGSRVTVLHNDSRLLIKEDPEVSALIERQFSREGIELIGNCTIHGVDPGPVLHYSTSSEEGVVAADALLIAVGRRPNVEDLNLYAAGIMLGPRGIIVDDYLRTSNKHIFAAGDAGMAFQFTHAADAAARMVVQNALFWGRKKLSGLTIPWCTYTDPEVAHVGYTATSAAAVGFKIDTYTRELADVDRARTDGETEGFVTIHCKKGTGTIVGATIVARHAGEMINEITMAMTHGLGLGRLADVIHPYPTQAEAIRQCGDAYRRTLLTPARKKLLARILSWRR